MRVFSLSLVVTLGLSSLAFVACGTSLDDDPLPSAGSGGTAGAAGKAGTGGSGRNGSAGQPNNGSGGSSGSSGGAGAGQGGGGAAGAGQGGGGAAGAGAGGAGAGGAGAGGAGAGGAGAGGAGQGGAGAGGAGSAGVGGAGGGGTIDFCNVQYPKTFCSLAKAEPILVYGQIYVAGLTDKSATPAAGLTVELGVGPSKSDPQIEPEKWTFSPAVTNPGFDFNQSNDEFQTTPAAQPAAGTFSVVYRVSLNGGAPKYCDADDTVDFNPARAAVWTVIDAGTCPAPTDTLP
ncbi:MAG: hypothetical protein MUF34_01575 [Polyangiaceae bacterium]|nr:hypothetical protein [Polyangiaceae bacterium]